MINVGTQSKKIEKLKNSKQLKEFLIKQAISPQIKNEKKQKLLKLNIETINILKVISAIEGKSQSEFVESLIDDAVKKYIDDNLI